MKIALKTAEPAARTSENFALAFAVAADVERFWTVLLGRKIS